MQKIIRLQFWSGSVWFCFISQSSCLVVSNSQNIMSMFRNSKNKPKDSCREMEPLYTGPVKKSQPNSSRYSQNFDFSHFPFLCETIWKSLNVQLADYPDVQKRMPYCLFLHAMNEYLNAYLIDVNRYEGVSVELENFNSTLQSIEASLNLIPTEIFEYIVGIGKVKTAAGTNVYFNLPVGGTPQGPLDATDDADAMESGSFGSCTAETHNSYECYVSPYVTRKLIERTLYANTTTDPDRFGDWSPLPKGRYPENGIANRNLLGYERPEKLDADGVAALRDLDFCNSDTPIGRISHCGKVLSRVTATLSHFCQKIKISNAHFDVPQVNSPAKDSSVVFIYDNSSKRNHLDQGSEVQTPYGLISPERFNTCAANKAKCFRYKRRRISKEIYPCYTVIGRVPQGWETTQNDNFNMIGTFAPRPGLCDMPSLRSDGFRSERRVRQIRRRTHSFTRIQHCINSLKIQNFDFSTFPLLCKKTWELFELEDCDLRKRMPYCLFLHVMTEILNTTLLSLNYIIALKNYGLKYLPSPISEYIVGIGTVYTAAGLEVDFNLPIGGTPQGPLDATDDADAMESGSFGSCTAETHNSYECYVSPYVTRKLIERTLYANTTTDPDRFGDWSPLPKGRYPENGIANRNLLGYQQPEKLDAEGVAALRDLDFCNNKTKYGRICHSKKAMKRVSDVFLQLSQKFDMKEICIYERVSAKHKSAAFICLNFRGTIAPGDRLAPHVDILTSPESFREATANKAYYFGYKRKRSPGSVGPCYTLGGEVPERWEETRNDNFNMLGIYGPKGGYKASLDNDDHISSIKSNRESDISTWLSCYFWKKKMPK